jgi:hypothetical protein
MPAARRTVIFASCTLPFALPFETPLMLAGQGGRRGKVKSGLRAKAVRFGPDGVGVQFLDLSKQERERFEKFMTEAHARAEDGGYSEGTN